MPGFTPKIPLAPSSQDGFYGLTKTLVENVKQNLKMIVLTSPGERIMNPNFGVGIRHLLFENFSDNLYRTFKTRLNEQIELYLPIVEIINVNFLDINKDKIDNNSAESNVLAVEIEYAITNMNIFDSLFIENISIGY